MQVAYNEDVVLPGGRSIPQGAWIDGAWRPTDGATRAVHDPASGAVLARVADASAHDVDAAVRSARSALAEWSARSVAARGAILERLADAIAAAADELARIETLDTGKPLAQSRTDVAMAEEYFRYYAHAARHLFGETIPTADGRHVRTERVPYGVVAHITPWNAPLSQLARGIAPSLAVGNVVVLKPSELAPLSSLLFADLTRDVLPAGILCLVQGDGETTGAALASHPGIDHLTFTGSVATGVRVAQAAAANVVATNLELGGKSAAIVFPDADVVQAAGVASRAIVRNSGQSCSALTRWIVHRSVHDAFLEALVQQVEGFSIGAGIDDATIGPLITRRQRDRVLALVADAVDAGATLRTGSTAAPTSGDLASGWFASPVVLADVSPDMDIARSEVFGPVQCVLAFDDEQAAISIANGTDYGLAAAVFTTDIDRAMRVSDALDAGQVQINGFVGAGAEIPFGGTKHSGHGREKGFEAMLGYTQLKAVVTHLRTS